jgi:hypothetical protein
MNEDKSNKTDRCEHEFDALGFDVYKKTDEIVEAVAAIFCKKCGLFRTKILTFRRELNNK